MTQLRELGKSGIAVSALGLGTMQFSNRGVIASAFPAVPQEQIDAIVKTAVDGGISWFDSAEMYGGGTSERCLSKGLMNSGIAPEQVTIATKWRQLGRTARSIETTADDRIKALSPYPIDLHQIHWPIGSFSSIRAEMTAMARLVEKGMIKAVGVSNFSARQMNAAHRTLAEFGIPLASNQVQINLLHRTIEHNGVLDTARRLGVTLIAYSPLASGVLTGKFHENPSSVKALSFPRRAIATGITGAKLKRTQPLIDATRTIAAAHDATVGQVALAWLTSYFGDTVIAIPGASKPHHAAEAAGALRVQLSPDEIGVLSRLSASALGGRR